MTSRAPILVSRHRMCRRIRTLLRPLASEESDWLEIDRRSVSCASYSCIMHHISMFYISHYKHIQLAALHKEDLSFVEKALNLLEHIDTTYATLLEAVECIILAREEQDTDAGAAAFVDANTIVILLSETTTLVFLASSLIHEATHLTHYQENPEEYKKQIIAEERAYGAQLDFLENVGSVYFYEYIAKQKESFLSWLKSVQSTDIAELRELQEYKVDMSYHTKLKEQYYKQYANNNE